MRRWYLLILLNFAFIGSDVGATIDAYEFDTEVQRLRYHSFIDEMRCPKCDNQSLSGSNSPIAMDLRREIYVMIKDGRSDKEIIDFMVERYGEAILYRPSLTPFTIILWFAPALLLLTGALVLLLVIRRRRIAAAQRSIPQALNEQERARLSALLNESSPVDSPPSSGRF